MKQYKLVLYKIGTEYLLLGFCCITTRPTKTQPNSSQHSRDLLSIQTAVQRLNELFPLNTLQI